jgi:hypothetical protein
MRPEDAGKGTGSVAGQQKTHTAIRVNPATGATETQEFTQEQWRQRDKSAGWTRPEGAEVGDTDDDSGGGDTDSDDSGGSTQL